MAVPSRFGNGDDSWHPIIIDDDDYCETWTIC